MKTKSFVAAGISALAILIGFGTFLPEIARAQSAGSNMVLVKSCVNTANGVRIKRATGPAYELKNGIRNAGHGLRKYTLTCVSSTKYQVNWVDAKTLVDLGLYGFVNLGKNNKEVQWNNQIVLTPNDVTNGNLSNPTFNLTYRIRNYGTGDAKGFKNIITHKGKIVSQKNSPSLAAGAIETINTQIKLKPKPGVQVLTFRVNAHPAIGEKSMANNTAHIRVVFSGFQTNPPVTGAPTIISPSHNQVLTNYPRVATIAWTGVANANQYQIELACDVCSSTTQKWLHPTFSTVTSTSFTTEPLPGDNEFRVRVRAYTTDGMVGPWSSYRHFRYNTSGASVTPNVQSISLTELKGMAPLTLDFDESHTGNLANKYWEYPGVSFTTDNGKVIYISTDNRGGAATASGAYSIAADANWPNLSNNTPFVARVRNGAQAVGFFLGNGNAYGVQVTATINFYGKDGQLLGSMTRGDIGDPVTTFVGAKSNVPIYKVTIDYGNTGLSEELDDFMFKPVMITL